MSVLLELEVDVSQLADLGKARKRIRNFEKRINKASGAYQNLAASSETATSRLEKSLKELVGKGVQLKTIFDSAGKEGRSSFSRVAAALQTVDGALTNVEAGLKKATANFALFGRVGRASINKVTAAAAKMGAVLAGVTGSVRKLKFAMLGLMFTSLNMALIFGGILALSPRIKARLVELAGALRLIALEAGEMVAPKIAKLSERIRGLDEESREFIARIAVIGTALSLAGVLIGAFGQAILTVLGPMFSFLKIFGVLGSVITGTLGIIGSAGGILIGIAGSVLKLGGVLKTVGVLFGGFAAKGIAAFGSLATAAVAKLAAAAGGILTGVAGSVFKLGGVLKTVGVLFGGFAAKGIAAFGSLATAAVAKLSATAGAALSSLGVSMVGTAGTVGAAASAIAGIFGSLASIIGLSVGVISGLLLLIPIAIAALLLAFSAGGGNIVKTMKSVAKKLKPLINGILSAFKNLTVEVLKLFGEMSVSIGKFIQKFSSQISNGIKPLVKGIGTFFIITFNVIVDALSQLTKLFRKGFQAISDFGVKAAKRMSKGWNEFIDLIFPALRSLVGLANKARKALGKDPISLPSKEDLKVSGPGGAFEGLLKDFDKKASQVQLDIAEVIAGEDAKKQVKSFQDAVDTALSEDKINKIGKGYEKVGNTLKDTAKNLENTDATIGNIVKGVKGLANKGKKGLLNMIPDGVLKKLNNVKKQLTGSKDKMDEIKNSDDKLAALKEIGTGAIGDQDIGELLGGSDIAQRGQDFVGDMEKGGFSDFKQTVKNEVNIEEPNIDNDIDMRKLAREMENRLNRNQKRSQRV